MKRFSVLGASAILLGLFAVQPASSQQTTVPNFQAAYSVQLTQFSTETANLVHEAGFRGHRGFRSHSRFHNRGIRSHRGFNSRRALNRGIHGHNLKKKSLRGLKHRNFSRYRRSSR